MLTFFNYMRMVTVNWVQHQRLTTLVLLELLFSLTSASIHDPREQKSVIVRRADCFDGCTACGAGNFRPVADSQGHLRTPLAVFRTSSCCDFAGTRRGYRYESVLLGEDFELCVFFRKDKMIPKKILGHARETKTQHVWKVHWWVEWADNSHRRGEIPTLILTYLLRMGRYFFIVAGRCLRWFLHAYYAINKPDTHR